MGDRKQAEKIGLLPEAKTKTLDSGEFLIDGEGQPQVGGLHHLYKRVAA